MKKLSMLFLFLVIMITLFACNKKEEDINTPKEFNTGDIVEYNGVIYEYIDLMKDIYPLTGKEALEYVFEDEEDYKAYYSYYYLDMSDYKNQPKLREDKDLVSEDEYLDWYTFCKHNALCNSPTHPYAVYVPTYFAKNSDALYIATGSFIVKGYTEDLPEEVHILDQIHGKYVTQIGYRAFENAPMKIVKCLREPFHPLPYIVHPFAFNNCSNLKEIVFEREQEGYGDRTGILMSMAISNCECLEKISGIGLTADCNLYNLPNLTKLEKSIILFPGGDPFPNTCYGMGGLKKSFFYNCPNLSHIDGEDSIAQSKITCALNTVYFQCRWGTPSYPIYVYNNYTAIVDDVVYTHDEREQLEIFSIMYNPDTLEAYVPFLNDGLEKQGEILFKHTIQDSSSVTEDEIGIYINAIYKDSKYNAKLLFKKK